MKIKQHSFDKPFFSFEIRTKILEILLYLKSSKENFVTFDFETTDVLKQRKLGY